jgi:hypothetical protein
MITITIDTDSRGTDRATRPPGRIQAPRWLSR